jgi:hypothetical protein
MTVVTHPCQTPTPQTQPPNSTTRHTMKFLPLSLLAATLLTGSPAAAQPAPEALQSTLTEALTLLGGSLVAPREHPPQVTRDGSLYRITIPLPGLSAPPNAAIAATAKPLDTGLWDIPTVTLPRAGTIPGAPGSTDSLVFTIGTQAIHGQLDPDLLRPSPFAAELGGITLRTDNAGHHADQSIERYTLNGSIAGDPDRRLNVQSQGSATNWRINTRDDGGVAGSSQIRSAAGSLGIEGLDRAQAARMATASRALATGLQADQSLSPTVRTQLRAMIDATAGLLTRLDAEESLQGIHIEASGANHADIGRMRVGLTSQARDDRLNAALTIALNEIALTAVPPDLIALIPQRVDLKPAISGVSIPKLLHLLRNATAPNPPDPAALQTEALALLADPNARVGIDAITIETAPLRVEGSVRLQRLSDGTAGGTMHLVATGLDAFLAKTQGNPRVQQILPMIFLAKGMARPQGDSLVWEIALANDGLTINGVPFGQALKGRPAPPSKR